jgi:hypothetical protein
MRQFDLETGLDEPEFELASCRAQIQLQAKERTREAVKTKGRVSIEPVLPVDLLGAYVLLP